MTAPAPPPVINLAERRAAAVVPDALACVCGGEWFHLRPFDGQPEPALAFTADGRVRAFGGVPVCADCGQVLEL